MKRSFQRLFVASLAFAFFLFSLVPLSAYERLDWSSRSLSAGKVNLVTGAYGVTRTLAVANFAPEFSLPIQIRLD